MEVIKYYKYVGMINFKNNININKIIYLIIFSSFNFSVKKKWYLMNNVNPISSKKSCFHNSSILLFV